MTYPFPQKDNALLPGIYFGLSAAKYHADSSLSRSGIWTLMKETPREFWETSWMNPACQHHAPTREMKWGEAHHALLLEPELFNKCYMVIPGDKWDDSKKTVKNDEYQMMKVAIDELKENGIFEQLFTGGYPEVTIVWPDPATGLLLRMRADYLKLFDSFVAIPDLKTATSLREEALKGDFRRYGYGLQWTMYMEGVGAIRALLRDKVTWNGQKVQAYGNVDKAWLKKFITTEQHCFADVVQKKKHPYPATVIDDLDEEDIREGKDMMEEGIKAYIQYMESHGPTRKWPASTGHRGTFSTRYGWQQRRVYNA